MRVTGVWFSHDKRTWDSPPELSSLPPARRRGYRRSHRHSLPPHSNTFLPRTADRRWGWRCRARSRPSLPGLQSFAEAAIQRVDRIHRPELRRTGIGILVAVIPSNPRPSSHIPKWVWASTKPGNSRPPRASKVSESSGQSAMGPTAAMRPLEQARNRLLSPEHPSDTHEH